MKSFLNFLLLKKPVQLCRIGILTKKNVVVFSSLIYIGQSRKNEYANEDDKMNKNCDYRFDQWSVVEWSLTL